MSANGPTVRYTNAIERGRRLFERFEARVADTSACDVNCDSIDLHYNVVRTNIGPGVDEEVMEAMDNMNVDLGNQYWKFVSVSSAGSSGTDPLSQNLFNPYYGAIACIFNDKFTDTNGDGFRLEWNQMLFRCWEDAAFSTQHSVKELKTIWRLHISNVDTRSIITKARQQPDSASRGDFYTEYRSDEDAFFAILGSPDGGGIAHFAVRFLRKLGSEIDRERPCCKGRFLPSFFFVLSEPSVVSGSAAKSKLSVAGERRKKKRLDKQGNSAWSSTTA